MNLKQLTAAIKDREERRIQRSCSVGWGPPITETEVEKLKREITRLEREYDFMYMAMHYTGIVGRPIGGHEHAALLVLSMHDKDMKAEKFTALTKAYNEQEVLNESRR